MVLRILIYSIKWLVHTVSGLKRLWMEDISTLFNSKNLGGNFKFSRTLERNKCLINVKIFPLLYLEILTGRSKYFFINNFISLFMI